MIDSIEDLLYFLLFSLPLCIALAIGEWNVLKKAGEQGWKSLIPFHNLFLSHHIAGMSHAWFILEIIFWIVETVLALAPAVPDWLEISCGIVIAIFTIVSEIIHLNKLCNCFGKPLSFKIGMFLIPEVFMMILGFDKSVYTAPKKH